jgi:hypothetical protein
MLRGNPYERKEVFCIVRNPFDRLISQYSWLNSMHLSDLKLEKNKRFHDNQLPENQRAGTSALRCSPRGFNDYLRRVLSEYEGGHPTVGRCHLLPNSRFVWRPDGQPACNLVLNYSTLAHDLDTAMAARGLPLRYMHLSNHSQPAQGGKCDALAPTDIADDNLRRIERVYATDFRRLNFSSRPVARRRDGRQVRRHVHGRL